MPEYPPGFSKVKLRASLTGERTARGRLYWSILEDQLLRATAGFHPADVCPLLPWRNYHGIRMRRRALRIPTVRVYRIFTTTEERFLRANIGKPYSQIAKQLKRTVSSVQNHARYLGLTKEYRQVPKVTGLRLYDTIRRWSFEAGILLKDLDRELKTGHYFSRYSGRETLNYRYCEIAVAFFDGYIDAMPNE